MTATLPLYHFFRAYLLEIFSLLLLLCLITMLISLWMSWWACINILAVKYISVLSHQCFMKLRETLRPVDFTLGTCAASGVCLPDPQTCIGLQGTRLRSEMSAPHATGSVFSRENPTAKGYVIFVCTLPCGSYLCLMCYAWWSLTRIYRKPRIKGFNSTTIIL